MKLSNDEAGAAAISSTHAIDIFAFVEAQEIPFSYFETPYYLSPAPGDEKVYALLRETLDLTKKIGIAHVVIQTRRRLAALIPCGPVLILNTLRLIDDACALATADRASENPRVKLTERELAMAATLVESMTQKYDLDYYREAFRDEVAMSIQVTGETRKNAKVGFDTPFGQPDAGHAHSKRFTDVFNRLEEDGAAGGNGETYQAQRNSRPRPRSRRILH